MTTSEQENLLEDLRRIRDAFIELNRLWDEFELALETNDYV